MATRRIAKSDDMTLKIRNEVEDFVKKIEEFKESSDDSTSRNLEMKLRILQYEVKDKVTDNHLSKTLMAKLNNCSTILNSKFKEIKIDKPKATTLENKTMQERRFLTDSVYKNIMDNRSNIIFDSRQQKSTTTKKNETANNILKAENNNVKDKITIDQNPEKYLNETEKQFFKIEKSIKNFIGLSSSEAYIELDLELKQILTKLKQLEIGNLNPNLQKKYNLLIKKILESNCDLKDRAADLENLTANEKFIATLLEKNEDMTDFEKEDVEEKLRDATYQLRRTSVNGLEQRKNYCLEKINDILVELSG